MKINVDKTKEMIIPFWRKDAEWPAVVNGDLQPTQGYCWQTTWTGVPTSCTWRYSKCSQCQVYLFILLTWAGVAQRDSLHTCLSMIYDPCLHTLSSPVWHSFSTKGSIRLRRAWVYSTPCNWTSPTIVGIWHAGVLMACRHEASGVRILQKKLELWKPGHKLDCMLPELRLVGYIFWYETKFPHVTCKITDCNTPVPFGLRQYSKSVYFDAIKIWCCFDWCCFGVS